MNIIEFPLNRLANKKTAKPLTTSRMKDDKIDFTCSECGVTATARFDKMLFRQIDCYCLGCGSFYRITNPAFAVPPPDEV